MNSNSIARRGREAVPGLIALETLACRVRLATAEQIAAIIRCIVNTNATVDHVRHCLQRLQSQGYVSTSCLALKVFELNGPIFRWRLGESFVEAHAIAWTAAQRVAHTEPRRFTLYRVTKKGARRCGVGNDIPGCQPTQLEHDLGCTAMLVAKLQEDASVAERWVGEDEIRRQFRPTHPKEFRKVPDAALIQETDRLELFLEFCGQYTAQRIERFHCHCQKHGIPYELY